MTRRSPLRWVITAGGPAAWAVDLSVSYGLVGPVRAQGDKASLYLVTSMALVIATTCAAIAGRAMVRRRRAGADERGPEHASDDFVERLSFGLNSFFVVAILAMAIPKIVLQAGD